jgi:hypothetical protein
MKNRKKTIRYTERFHAHRLELMLNRNDICKRCPAIPAKQLSENFDMDGYFFQTYTERPCKVCKLFVIKRLSREDMKMNHILPWGYITNTELQASQIAIIKDIWADIVCPCGFLRDPVIASLKAIAKYRAPAAACGELKET